MLSPKYCIPLALLLCRKKVSSFDFRFCFIIRLFCRAPKRLNSQIEKGTILTGASS